MADGDFNQVTRTGMTPGCAKNDSEAWKDHRREVMRWHLEEYRRTKNPLQIWMAYAQARELAEPMPTEFGPYLDGLANRLFQHVADVKAHNEGRTEQAQPDIDTVLREALGFDHSGGGPSAFQSIFSGKRKARLALFKNKLIETGSRNKAAEAVAAIHGVHKNTILKDARAHEKACGPLLQTWK